MKSTTRRACLAWWFCALVLSADAIQIVAQTENVQVINGRSRVVHTATVKCTQDTIGTHTLELKSGTTTRQVEFTCAAPQYIYDHNLVGWIPRVQYQAYSRVCMRHDTPNSTSLGNDNATAATTSSAVLGYPARRLLSFLESSLPPNTWAPPGATQPSRPAARRLLNFWDGIGGRIVYGAERGLLMAGSLVVGAKLYRGLRRTPGAAEDSGKFIKQKYKSWRGTKDSAKRVAENDPPGGPADIEMAEVKGIDNFGNAEEVVGSDAFEAQANSVAFDSAGMEAAAADAGAAAGEAAGAEAAAAAVPGLGEMVFGMAVLGIATSFMCDGALGSALGCGGGDPSHYLKMVQQKFEQIDQEMQQIGKWMGHQQAWDAQVSQQFVQQASEDAYLQTQISRNTESINDLSHEVESLALATTHTTDQLMTEMGQVGDAITESFNESLAIWRAVKWLHGNSSARIRANIGQIERLAREVQRLEVIELNHYRKLYKRRAMTALFHHLNSVPTPRESAPFLKYLGKPPMTAAERDALATPAQARRVGSAILMGTLAGYVADWINVSVVCNPMFLVNTLNTRLSPQQLFDHVGPPGCKTGGYNDPWTCRCAIRVERLQCTSAPGREYPWDVDQTILLDQIHTDPTSPCNPSGYTFQQTDSASVFYDTYAGWKAFLEPLCATGWLPEPAGVAAGELYPYRLRVSSDRWAAFNNLTLNVSEAGPNVCTASWVPSLDPADQEHKFLAYNIYQLWTRSYQAIVALELQHLETEIFGKIPSDLTYQDMPFNTAAEEEQTYECSALSFVKTGVFATPGHEKLPMYSLYRRAVQKDFVVKVDGQIIQNATQDATVGYANSTTRALQGGEGNVTVTTQVFLDNDAASLLPGVFLRFGRWLDDPVGPGVNTWDVPFDQVTTAINPQGRAGKINYLFQPAGWFETGDTTSFNLTQWQEYYSTYLDATAVGFDPTAYKRRLLAISNVRYVCDQAYSSGGTVPINNTNLFEWCNILEHYDVQTYGAYQDLMGFSPQRFELLATVEVPGGTFVTDIATFCPSATSVTLFEGGVTVQLNTTSSEQVTVDWRFYRLATPNSPIQTGSTVMSAFAPGTAATDGNVEAFQPLYFQVRPVGATTDCYSGNGIPVQASHTISSWSGVPGPVAHAVATVEDRTYLDLLDQLSSTSEYIASLLDLENQPWNDDAEIEAAAQAIAQQRIAVVNNMSLADGRMEHDQKRVEQQIHDTTDRIEQRVKANRQDAITSRAINNRIEENNQRLATIQAAIFADGQTFHTQEEASKAYTARMDQVLQTYLKSDHADGSNDCPALIKPLCDLMNSLFGGLMNMLKSIMMFFLYIALAVAALALLYCAVKACVEGSCTSHHDPTLKVQANTGGHSHREDDDHDPEPGSGHPDETLELARVHTPVPQSAPQQLWSRPARPGAAGTPEYRALLAESSGTDPLFPS